VLLKRERGMNEGEKKRRRRKEEFSQMLLLRDES